MSSNLHPLAAPALRPSITVPGLILALLGLPAFVLAFRSLAGEIDSNVEMISREVMIFMMVGLLLLVVRYGEELPLSSIGLHVDRLGRSLAWGSGFAIVMLAVTVGLYLGLQAAGIQLGEGSGRQFKPSLWTLALVMLRAGVVEEICFRGYAIERLKALSGSTWLAALLPLLFFTLSHYRQGMGGMIAAAVLGALFTVFYLSRRDLVANIIAHFLVDLVLNVGIPAVSG